MRKRIFEIIEVSEENDMTLRTTMGFTKDELLLMNEGIIRLIGDANKAIALVSYGEAQKNIKIRIEDLQESETKLSHGSENAWTFP